jgi:hypothetical protein
MGFIDIGAWIYNPPGLPRPPRPCRRLPHRRQDKAYDTNAFRALLAWIGNRVCIPPAAGTARGNCLRERAPVIPVFLQELDAVPDLPALLTNLRIRAFSS